MRASDLSRDVPKDSYQLKPALAVKTFSHSVSAPTIIAVVTLQAPPSDSSKASQISQCDRTSGSHICSCLMQHSRGKLADNYR